MDAFRQIYYLFRNLQHENKFSNLPNSTRLSALERHFLIELAAAPESPPQFYSSVLGINNSSLSRMIQGLVKKKMIQLARHPADSRKSFPVLTKQGLKTLAEIDMNANSAFERKARYLEKSELEELTCIFERIADSFNQVRTQKRPNESGYRVQQRRITRAFGFLKDSVFGSTFTLAEWNVLIYLQNARYGTLAKEISESLIIPQNSVSVILAKFEKLKLLKRIPAKDSKKEKLISLTATGQKAAKKIESQAIESFIRALDGFDTQKIGSFTQILGKFVGQTNKPVEAIVPESLRILTVSGVDELRGWRGFALRQLVKARLENQVSSNILDENSDVYAVELEGEKAAVFELAVQKDGKKCMVNAAWDEALVPNYLNAAVKIVKADSGVKENLKEFVKYTPLLRLLSE